MTIQAEQVTVYPEATPNPASLRYLIEQRWLPSGTVDFPDSAQAERSPLAQKLFAIDGVRGVMVGPNFVTVTATAETDWTALSERVIPAIQEFVASGETAVIGGVDGGVNSTGEGKTPIEQGIIRVIETEIRPAVAMDGGDIIFGGYNEGIVSLHLRGSCSGCPSSMMTLKMGIERRLKEEFPEIVSVEAV